MPSDYWIRTNYRIPDHFNIPQTPDEWRILSDFHEDHGDKETALRMRGSSRVEAMRRGGVVDAFFENTQAYLVTPREVTVTKYQLTVGKDWNEVL